MEEINAAVEEEMVVDEEVAAVEENIDAENSDVIDLIQLVNPEEEIPLDGPVAVLGANAVG